MEEEILLTIDIAIRLIYMKTASENSYTEIESMFKGIKDAIGDENWKVTREGFNFF